MIAITNGQVMTITQGTLDRGTVLIEGGRIVALGEGWRSLMMPRFTMPGAKW